MKTVDGFDGEIRAGATPEIAGADFGEGSREECDVGGTGLDVSALQWVARRQLVGSIAAVVAVALFAGSTVLRPVHSGIATHFMTTVQQPALAQSANHRVAAVKRVTELP